MELRRDEVTSDRNVTSSLFLSEVRPACRCGVPKKPDITRFGKDDGLCHRHPERGAEAWRKRDAA
jgi:hypothetical protein